MSTFADHARSMMDYTAWANERVLAAASGLDPHDFDRISGTLAHLLGTQLFWHANWTNGDFADPVLQSAHDALGKFTRSHEQLRDFAAAMDASSWDRAEAWWKKWGYEVTAPLGVTLTQVFMHGIQHRAEVSLVLTELGHSPGDQDYLAYLQERLGA